MNDIVTVVKHTATGALCNVSSGDNVISSCFISRSSDNTWTISKWKTERAHRHGGYGKTALSAALNELYRTYGSPKEILYNWNGLNSYVLDWMERNFHAKCNCSIAMLKYEIEDKWKITYTL